MTPVEKWKAIAQRHPNPSVRAKAADKVKQLGEPSVAADEIDMVAGAGPDRRMKDTVSELGPTAAVQAATLPKSPKVAAMDDDVEREAQGMMTATGVGPWLARTLGTAPKTIDEARDRVVMGRSMNPDYAKKRVEAGDQRYETVAKAPEAAQTINRAATNLGVGMMTGGLANAGMRAVAGRAVGAGATKYLAPLAADAAVGSGAANALDTAQDGGDLGEVAEAAFEGAGGGVAMGLPLAGAGAGAKKVVDKLTDKRKLIGRTTRALDEGKAKGYYDSPEFKELPEGKEGYLRAADDAGQEFTKYNEAKLGGARSKYKAGIDEITAESGGKAIGLEPVHNRLDALAAENTVNGVAIDEGLGKALEKVRAMVTKKTGIIARDTGQEIAAQAGTLEDILKTKKAVQTMAEFGKPVTPENRPYRLIYKELAQAAEEIDPRLAGLNKEFGSTMDELERANDIVTGKATPEVEGRAGVERRAAGTIGRIGDDTTAGVLGSRHMDELAALDPKYKELLDKVEFKKAWERTRFGLPKISASPEKWSSVAMTEQLANALGARAVLPAARMGFGLAQELTGPVVTGAASTGFFADPADAIARRKRKDKEKKK